jgi:hypothetical protein
MTFDEILAQVLALLQREKRLSYRALTVRFALDDDHLEALKEEIIEAKQLVVDEHGKVLVWTGSAASPPTPAPASERAPRTYTPPYLAEKILTSRSALEGERKQVTVLFADIKDSTELIRDLDPRSRPASAGPRPASHDGGGTPLRGHGEPGVGRRHYGPLWGPPRS